MEHRIAVVGIIVENYDSVEKLNGILHEYADYIIGRMGIPYGKRHVNIISVAMDAPQDVVGAMADRLSRLDGISAKTACSSLVFPAD